MVQKIQQNQKITHHHPDDSCPFISIDDPQSQLAHFSLSVRAGHFFDPLDNQGLAHLLEHMLFLGSRQLPAPNQLIDYIQQLGGTVNAWTAGEYANYHFSCAPAALSDAIPAFLDALFHPLIAEHMITNEIRSIDAEFHYKRKDELRRLYQIHKETCNPDHPFSKFSVGNAKLFQRHSISQLRKHLRNFHQTYYHKGNICVAVSSPQLTDKAIDTLTRSLSRLPSGVADTPQWPLLYREQDLQIQINVKPLQKARRLIITFAVLTEIAPLQKALHYISHLLGDESKGSLLAYLRAKGWATNLITGNGIEGTDFRDFNINIQLTDEGERQLTAVIDAFFYTLELIREDDAVWRKEEKTALDRLAREFSETPLSLDSVCELAESLFLTNNEVSDTPCSDQDIERALSWLNPNYMRLKLISPSVITDTMSRHYDAEYSVLPLANDIKRAAASPKVCEDIVLSTPNQYVVSNPQRCERDSSLATPKLLHEHQHAKLWFSQEQSFNSVKGDLYCSFDVPEFSSSPLQNLSKRVWLQTVNNQLQESLYRANIAGLHYRLYGHQCGFTVHCRGFSQALLPLASQVINTTFSDQLCARSFETAIHTQHRNLSNSLINKPINRLFSRLGVLVQRYSYAPYELLDTLQSLTFDRHNSVVRHALSKVYNESFLHGNWTLEHASQWQQMLQPLSHRFNASAMSRDVIQLPAGQSLLQDVPSEHDDAAVVVYLQAPNSSAQQTAFCMVVEQLLAGPFFNALRTEQQLGYVVGTGFVPHNQHPGIVFYIQSPAHDVNQLLQAMVRFLREQINDLGFYQNYWPNIQKNLHKQVSEADTNLAMQSQRLWLNLGLGDANNQRKQELVNIVNNMSFDDLVSGAQQLISRTTFGELILYTKGRFTGMSDEFGTKITNLDEFKANARFFP